ncbi:MAG TPA: aminopeptidase P family protein [Candidatus Cloacimonetes bacterium]|nr:aminopeptidase P family protein [Candidatus Cloacimonadota bacterium]HEX37791.1 aminopeptidase P family protein [Candidatus Cloacimonadota bacterium]
MKKQFYISNRKAMSKLMPDKSFAIFSATRADTGNLPGEFVQDANFFYLTGLKVANAQLIVAKHGKKSHSMLFIERNIPEMEVWIGKKLSKNDAQEISGIEKVYYIDEFPNVIHPIALSNEVCYYDHISSKIGSNLSDSLYQLKQITTHYPTLTIQDPGQLLTQLRAAKKKAEIEEMRKAIRITHEAILNVMNHTKPGMMEYELEAHFRFECVKNNAKQMAFSPIIASGENATILHYEKNNGKVGKDDLVLVDVGAKWNEYCADITRTFPANGTFSTRQREVYEAVLAINKAIIKKVKPGLTLKNLQDETIKLMKKALKELNLIKKDEEFKKYYMHGVSHTLGLAAHDLVDRSKKLEKGWVITVEPGIYIPEEGIGVRIEDDVLVTQDGYENLSSIIPKEVDEIEAIMHHK